MSVPQTMCAMMLTGHGGPDMLAWREDVPVKAAGPGEVLIKVHAAAVNNTDINTRTGWYSKRVRGDTASGAGGYGASADGDGGWSGALSFPRIQGADCCGTIAAVGAGVDADRIGDRVLVRPIQAKAQTQSAADKPGTLVTFGSEYDGAFAQYTVAPSKDAIRIASPLSDTELASFPCAFSTAEGMIQRCGLGAERVLITGASGGVGSAAIQLAKRRGAHVTAITSPQKAADLVALGADETLGRDTAPPAGAFDVVLDVVGGAHWPRLVESLRDGGRYAVSGAIAGPIVELDLRTLYLHDLSFFGCTHQADSAFTDLVGYIERGEIRPVVAETFALYDLRAAQEAFMAKAHIGKIAIAVDG